jgi:hypothetical protein
VLRWLLRRSWLLDLSNLTVSLPLHFLHLHLLHSNLLQLLLLLLLLLLHLRRASISARNGGCHPLSPESFLFHLQALIRMRLTRMCEVISVRLQIDRLRFP